MWRAASAEEARLLVDVSGCAVVDPITTATGAGGCETIYPITGAIDTTVDLLAPVSMPDSPVPGVPLYPPPDWFERSPDLAPGGKITVVTSGEWAGRVWGYVAPWGVCLLDGTTECWTAKPSPTAYAAAHQGETTCADGTIVATANIGGGVNHAGLWSTFEQAVDHYANTAAQLVRCRYGEDSYGIWMAGALWPHVTWRNVALIRASALSGDWRWRHEYAAFDFTGSQLVNIPGFPLDSRPNPAYHALGSAGRRPEMIVGGFAGAYAGPDVEEVPMQPQSQPSPVQVFLNAPPAAHPAGCTCGAHTAADVPSGPPTSEAPGAPAPAEAEDLAARVEALTATVADLDGRLATVEEIAMNLQNQMAADVVAAALKELDAMDAALPVLEATA